MSWPQSLAALQHGLLCCVLGLALVTQAQAQAQAKAPITLSDDRGQPLQFAAAPQRIVSLLPSLTEGVCALGACDRLVGVDRFSNWPASLAAVPKLGGLEDPQIERIVALKPDVVLASRSQRVAERLQALGLKLVLLESQTHADVQRSLLLLATLLGQPERGVAVWQGIERDIALARSRVPAQWQGASVYFEVASAPYAAGSASFLGESLARLGLVNIVPADMGPFPRLNPEFVLRSQPRLVMAHQREAATMAARPGWQRLRALHNGLCAFASAPYDVLVRPGPRLGEAALLMADCLNQLPAVK